MHLLFSILVATSAAFAATPSLDAAKAEAARLVDSRRQQTQQIVDTIFSISELGFQEHETADYICDLLRREGFEVQRGVAGMPTAFVATWGSGKPVVGIMADIDGLPQTSQKPGVAYHAPLIPDGPGHGEGHNAGQAVLISAALAVKTIMQQQKLPGTIRIYPGVAEELLASRNYMVRAGLFTDLDVMLSTHIDSAFTTSWGASGTGLVSTQYTFEGKSAHGASAWNGRSALDAVELMNVGWNYRREHLRPEQRSHYVITNGGDQPNVVPPLATVWYFLREWDYERIRDLHATATRIAQGAATMTDTKMTERVLAATWPAHFNRPLAEALQSNIERVGMPEWSENDQTLARAAQKELGSKESGLNMKVPALRSPSDARGGAGSDDIAEVSWNVPTINLRYPANIPGLIAHHWSSGIAMATPIAHKGAVAGAKAMAMTMLDVLLRPDLVSSARSYFAEQTKETKWVSLVPEGTNAPIELNKERMERFRPELRKLRYDPARYRTYLEQLGITYPTFR
jgi:aminobenzoyl-glutamate utilization protein B